MVKTNRVSLMRLAYVLLMTVTFIIGTTIMCSLSNILIDQFVCIIAIDICFLLLLVLTLTKYRLEKKLPESNYISYGKIMIVTVSDWIIIILCMAFAPDFFAPVMIIPLVGSAVFDNSTNVVLSIYYLLIFSICQNFTPYILICYMLLIVFSIICITYLKTDDSLEKILGYVILLSVNVLVPTIFYYFNYLEIQIYTFLYSLIDSIIVCVVAATIMPILSKRVINDQIDIYMTILDPEYSLIQDIRKFSYIEYQHACRVSKLSRICAKEIGVNEDLAAAGGMYYRLGKLEGEPMIDNAVKISNNHCFPLELIDILSEYGAIIEKPSTPESAIVHMVDSVVTKVELFDADSMTSSWNQNMVIYQTINELSQKGFYDNANLSMNQFLLIRERLAKEDILA